MFILPNTYWSFLKWWYPQITHFNRVFHYKPSILGYPYFWKHPYPAISTYFAMSSKSYQPTHILDDSQTTLLRFARLKLKHVETDMLLLKMQLPFGMSAWVNYIKCYIPSATIVDGSEIAITTWDGGKKTL